MRMPALFLALLLMFPIRGQAGESIRITNGEWLPFFSASLDGFGGPSRIVADAFALEGIKVEYGFFPWKRSYMLSLNGDWDGAIGWPFGEERAKTHYYSKRPINSGKWVFFHRKDMNFIAQSIDDLKTYKFGVTVGEWVLDGDDYFTTTLRKGLLTYERVRTDEQIFLMLARRRIDVFPQQVDVGYYQIQQLQKQGRMTKAEAANVTHFEKAYRSMPLYLLLSRKVARNERMIQIFDQSMERLHKIGRLE